MIEAAWSKPVTLQENFMKHYCRIKFDNLFWASRTKKGFCKILITRTGKWLYVHERKTSANSTSNAQKHKLSGSRKRSHQWRQDYINEDSQEMWDFYFNQRWQDWFYNSLHHSERLRKQLLDHILTLPLIGRPQGRNINQHGYANHRPTSYHEYPAVGKGKSKSNHLLFLDRFKDLDYAFFVVGNIYTFKNLTVFSPSNFPNNFIVLLITEFKKMREGDSMLSKHGKYHFLFRRIIWQNSLQ